VNSDNIAMLHPQVVAHDSVYPRRAIVEIVIGKDDQDRILALLALDEDGVAAEQLERLHGVVGEGDDGVVIVDGIGDAGKVSIGSLSTKRQYSHQRVWLLLLFEDSRRGLINLWRVSNRAFGGTVGRSYIFVLCARWISANC
jgi:hypothetical protein